MTVFRMAGLAGLAIFVWAGSGSLSCFAQSWGQFKEAAVQAQSERKYGEAEDFWQKAVNASEGVGARHIQSLAGLARCYAAQENTAATDATYKKVLSLVSPGDKLGDDARIALTEYCGFLRNQNRESEATDLEKKFDFSSKSDNGAIAESAPAPPAIIPVRKPAPMAKPVGVDDSEKWQTLFKAGIDQQNQKHMAAAEKTFKDALVFAEKQNQNPAFLSQTLARLIGVCSAQGKVADCELYSRQYLGVVRQISGPISVEFAEALGSHAKWLRRLDKKAEAMAEEAKGEAIMAKAQPAANGSGGYVSPAAVDVSGTKGGSIYSRARSLQGGFTGRINDMLKE